jgi:hypothetical protein
MPATSQNGNLAFSSASAASRHQSFPVEYLDASMCNQCAKSTGNDSGANRTIAAIPSARLRRNVYQTWDGGRLPFAVYFAPPCGKCKRRGINRFSSKMAAS